MKGEIMHNHVYSLATVSLVIAFNLFLLPYEMKDEDTSSKFKFGKIVIEVSSKGEYATADRVLEIKVTDQNRVTRKLDKLADYLDSAWVTDLDKDRNPEVIIVERSGGSGSSANCYLYEYVNSELMKRNLPDLNEMFSRSYQGHDKFYLSGCCIKREFPIYKENDANCCPTGGDAKIEYEFADNHLQEKSLSVNKTSAAVSPKNSLVFTLVSVYGLPDMDQMSASDCWLEVVVDGISVGKTEKTQDNNSPTYNKRFGVRDYAGGQIIIKAYDHDMTKEELIGEATIEKPISGEYPLSYETSDGSVRNGGYVQILFEK